MSSKKIPLLTRKAGLYLKPAGAKGRGVFCRTALRKGEVLEVTPALILNEKETDITDKTILGNYTFGVGKITKRLMKASNLKKPEDSCAVLFGMVSFCNHSETPNATVIWEENAGTLYYSLVVTKAIPSHTEICTSYGDGWFDDRK